MKKLTNEEFIERAKKTHPEYDYSITQYTNKRTKLKYICPIHGEREQLPDNLIKSGCSLCSLEKEKNNKKLPLETLLERFKKTHGDKYDYSKINYINIDTPIEIICKEHGSFFQSPYEHQNGSGCPKCYGRYKTNEDFINKATIIHNNKYDYSKTIYTKASDKISIICPKHGEFFQKANNHLNGCGCPYCGNYKGEEIIKNYLTSLNINFEFQKTFENCFDKGKLKFDFYIPNKNIAIEYDGIQHFSPISFGKGSVLEYNLKHDKIKEDFCKNNNISLIRINYEDFDNIEEILNKYFNKTFKMKWPENFDTNKYALEILNNLKDFPYDHYTNKQLIDDYSKINNNPLSFSGLKIVRHFHKNIYSSRVRNKPTPLEAWNNKELLLKTIINRMTYHKPPYTPEVIKEGLNISKIAPKVSVFKPSLAKYLILKYLNDCNTIFDPFSGFSGRMLGSCSIGKKYIGQDINKEQVLYSNQIINFFNLNAVIYQKDVFESFGEYECLFTCSPYGLKESWNNNETNLNCDEWIDICLKNFKCKKYLFVVDSVEKYKEFIVEKIINRSHFGSNSEKIVLIKN